jgi:hypothetical protein
MAFNNNSNNKKKEETAAGSDLDADDPWIKW